jgi:hypothetical protein
VLNRRFGDVIYKGGKRSLLNIVKGDWRGRG